MADPRIQPLGSGTRGRPPPPPRPARQRATSCSKLLGSEPQRCLRVTLPTLLAFAPGPAAALLTLALQPTPQALALVDPASATDGDLEAAEFLLEFAPLSMPPYGLAAAGLAIGVLCGLTFSRLVSLRLEGWKQDRLPLLPLARTQTVLPWIGLLLGITLFLGGSLQVFGFAAGAALLVALLLSLATGGALWLQLARLMAQVQAGTFRAVDFDNFDQFF